MDILNSSSIRSISTEEYNLIGGGLADAPFAGIAPGGCVIYPQKTPTKSKFPSDDTND
jgi:hypothetical protein